MAFIVPVVLAAWIGGWWPGLVMTLTGVVAQISVVQFSRTAGAGNDLQIWIHVSAFSFVGLLISWVFERSHRGQHELGTREALIRRVLDGLYAYVGLMSPDGTLLMANEASLKGAGATEEEVFGRLFHEAPWWSYSPAVQERLLEAIEKARRGETDRFDVEHPKKDGGKIWVDFMLSPLFNANGEVEYLIPSSTDITARKQREKELKAAEQKAEAANQAKTLFLANMSHEIRTPLGVMLGFAELLEDNGLTDEDRSQLVQTILRNGRQLTNVINEILDVSKIESNSMEIEQLEFDFQEVWSDVLSIATFKAREKGLEFDCNFESEIPRRVISDPTRIRQIFTNVIGNAVKFTARGGIQIRIRAVKADSQSSEGNRRRVRLEFDVQDTGLGLSEDQLSRIFRPFGQADNTMSRRFGGTGLGLYLSRRLAQALGGDLVLVRTAPGEGSVFRVSLIAEVAEGDVAEAARVSSLPVPVGAKALHGVRILVVDDSDDNQKLLDRILRHAGAKCDFASNGWSGVEMAICGSYDVVLMDLQMPVLDGYESLRELKGRQYQKPVIALTAHALEEERVRTAAAGFVDHLVKPIDRALLIDVISRLVGRGVTPQSRASSSF